MKIFALLASGTIGAAAAEHYAAAGEPPLCEVDASGLTHVYYSTALHPSFKCSHSGDTCACTLKHPTHHTGGCKQFESKAAGNKLLSAAGDCTDSGKDGPTPTYTGSDPAAHFNNAVSGSTIILGEGTLMWNADATCSGKTITLQGQGKAKTTSTAARSSAATSAPSRAATLF
jgi:hypothetical protein